MHKTILTCDSGIDPMETDNMIPGIIIEKTANGTLKEYKDVLDIRPKDIFEKMKNGSTFSTSCPIYQELEDKFISLLEAKYDVIHLAMSSGISEGSVNAPFVIAKELNSKYLNKVYVIDTLNATTGGTLLSEIAKKLISEDREASEIVRILNEVKSRINTSFFVPYPAGFINSGRDKSSMYKDKALKLGAKALTLTGIKCRVDFNEEGDLYLKSFNRKKTSTGFLNLVEDLVNYGTYSNYDPNYVVIGNLNENHVNMNEVIKYLEELKYFYNIIRQDINSVVAPYGSDDLCGISLLRKKSTNKLN